VIVSNQDPRFNTRAEQLSSNCFDKDTDVSKARFLMRVGPIASGGRVLGQLGSGALAHKAINATVVRALPLRAAGKSLGWTIQQATNSLRSPPPRWPTGLSELGSVLSTASSDGAEELARPRRDDTRRIPGALFGTKSPAIVWETLDATFRQVLQNARKQYKYKGNIIYNN